MLVELKNGETLNGHLVQCDTYMNLTLKEVVQTSPDGDKFFRLPECYVRGNNVSLRSHEDLDDGHVERNNADKPLRASQIKYLRVPDEIVDIVKEQQATAQAQRGGGHRGGRGGDRGDRGRGRGQGGRGRGRGGRGQA